jgi:hypothetical protein
VKRWLDEFQPSNKVPLSKNIQFCLLVNTM